MERFTQYFSLNDTYWIKNFKSEFRLVVVKRRDERDSVSDNDLWTHLREYLECLMWKGSLGFTNVSCKSIREATHQIKTPCKSTAASVRGCRHIYLRYRSTEALMQLLPTVWNNRACLDFTEWPRVLLPSWSRRHASPRAYLTSCCGCWPSACWKSPRVWPGRCSGPVENTPPSSQPPPGCNR